MARVNYMGVFFDAEVMQELIERQGEKLPKLVKNMHCTFRYAPSNGEIKNFMEIVGQEFEIKVVGYCSDGKNSGYEIEIGPELNKYYNNTHTIDKDGIPTVEPTSMHITVSMSEDGKAVDTGMLPFERLPEDKQFAVKGKAGVFMLDKEKGNHVSFDIKEIEPTVTENSIGENEHNIS